MFRNIKKRVKNLSNSVHGRINSTNGGDRDDDIEKLNTPARQYSGLPPPIPSVNSPSANTVSTSGSDGSSGQAYRQKPIPKSTATSRRGKKTKNILDIPLDELDVISKIEYLAPFDICVQASDALAAASGLSDHRHAKQEDSVIDEIRIDEETGLRCTSILVSPDGFMLLMPPSNKRNDNASQQHATNEVTEEKPFLDNNAKIVPGDAGHCPTTETHEDNEDVGSFVEGDDQEVTSNFAELRLNCKDDFESSVYVGHDLHPSGDKALNGFSAKGWSIPATSLAMEQTEQSLNAFAHFCEQMILSRKESAARTAFACDNLRRAASTIQQGKSTQDSSGSWVIIDPRAGDFEMTPSRTGPLLSENSTLAVALSAVEEYYITESENESHRWRTASLQRDMILPKLHEAVDHLHERSLKRQQALQECSRRASVLEDRVRALQQVAESRWQAVYDAEEQVTVKQQKLMEERRQQREKARLEKLKGDEAIRMQETTAVNKGDAALGATSKEIWDMVSSAVDPASDFGSFEPIDLPTAPLSAPRDLSVEGGGFDDQSVNSMGANSVDTLNTNISNLTDNLTPLASRDEIAHGLGLPQLRATAMKADEDVRDTADSLLNVLSTLDTTRRSARIASEVCLLSAMNSQAAGLQSWIQLERESLGERLKGLNAIEDKIKSNFSVRSDLDAYISSDKKERGGLSHLGEDDDGGIASALAVLSSHVDGAEREVVESHEPHDINDDNESTSQIMIDEAIEKLFDENFASQTNKEVSTDSNVNLESSVQLLCRIAMDKSRAKRSGICYALNTKRSSHAKVKTEMQFDGLTRLFDAILKGCNAEVEVGGVSNAKMCMMLSQTFYLESQDGNINGEPATSEKSRKSRIYVKNALITHPIWAKDDYWDIALTQQISESLTHSGVMSNFEKSNSQLRKRSEYAQNRKTRWYDLNQTERIEAASQVHAVVFAQLGALAHSMLEFGCGLERACAFVRRMSIRNQLPSTHRTMLLMHLLERKEDDRIAL